MSASLLMCCTIQSATAAMVSFCTICCCFGVGKQIKTLCISRSWVHLVFTNKLKVLFPTHSDRNRLLTLVTSWVVTPVDGLLVARELAYRQTKPHWLFAQLATLFPQPWSLLFSTSDGAISSCCGCLCGALLSFVLQLESLLVCSNQSVLRWYALLSFCSCLLLAFFFSF